MSVRSALTNDKRENYSAVSSNCFPFQRSRFRPKPFAPIGGAGIFVSLSIERSVPNTPRKLFLLPFVYQQFFRSQQSRANLFTTAAGVSVFPRPPPSASRRSLFQFLNCSLFLGNLSIPRPRASKRPPSKINFPSISLLFILSPGKGGHSIVAAHSRLFEGDRLRIERQPPKSVHYQTL